MALRLRRKRVLCLSTHSSLPHGMASWTHRQGAVIATWQTHGPH